MKARTSPDEFTQATARAKARRRAFPRAIAARYDRRTNRISITLESGIELGFSPKDAEELHRTNPAHLRRIEITPSGLGIHFPDADADIYVPALLEGLLGSRRWMAARLGYSGGKSRSAAKAAASRANGKLGGRPRKSA